jgi:hypothetical protein
MLFDIDKDFKNTQIDIYNHALKHYLEYLYIQLDCLDENEIIALEQRLKDRIEMTKSLMING